jgi:hypothetical protein
MIPLRRLPRLALLIAPLAALGAGTRPENDPEPSPATTRTRSAGRPEALERYRALMREGREALESGAPARAAALFEDASHLDDETPEAELAMVQAHLEAGEYRKALATATLVAGEHPGSTEAEAFLAWIELLGGQGQVARRRLAAASARAPGDPPLGAVQARILSIDAGTGAPPLSRSGPALDPTARRDRGAAATAQGRATGVLVAGGTRVLTTASAASDGKGLWVRDAVGRARRAALERVEGGVAVLRLSEPLDAGSGFAAEAMARAFPGSPCYVVQYPVPGLDRPAWPVLSAGFLGRALPEAGMVELSLDLPPGPRGGAVLDARGRLVGLVLAAGSRLAADRASAGDLVALASVLQPLLPANGDAPDAAAGGAPPRIAVGEAYERALLAVVVVLGPA